MKLTQFPLPIHVQTQMTFKQYLPNLNELAVNSLKNLSEGIAENYIYLWGVKGVGRSHLLQACCYQAQQCSRSAQYLPLSELITYSPVLLESFENFDMVCIDDIQLITGYDEWEEALFHLYNRLHQLKKQLVISANVPPRQLNIQLQDLKSRLTAGLIFHLHELDDASKILALQMQAQQRGMILPHEVCVYLLKRFVRDFPTLLKLLNYLDRASLAAQRKLTIPFVKKVLEAYSNQEE